MNRLQSAAIIATATGMLLATSCVTDSCGCVTVPASREERWSGGSSLGDSLELGFRIPLTGPSVISGSGQVRLKTGLNRAVDFDGSYDGTSPEILTIRGWADRPLVWRRTTVRADSVFGSVGFLGPSPTDTMTLTLSPKK